MRLALSLVLAFICFASIVRGQASACGTNCTGWSYGDDLFTGPGYGVYGLAYVHDSSQPIIRALHPTTITTAAIIIHGLGRDADDYYCYFKYALNAAGKADSTFFIAPRFMLAADSPATNQFFWVSNTAWMTGGKSDMSTSRIASFQILDDLLKAFDNKTYFPGLQQILVVGHSAGAQMAHRYAVATGVDSSISVPIRYVVENSGSYTYLDTNRAILPNITATIPNCYACNATQILVDTYTFQTVDRATQQACPVYNDWKMGLDNANVYVNKRNSTTIRTEYAKKNVTYLLGTDDTCNDLLGPDCGCDDSSLDTGCDAEMQGFCRLHRGVIYYQYLQSTYGKQIHTLKYVEGLAHDGCGMITSVPSLESIFPDFVPATDAPTSAPTTDASSTSGTTDASSTSGTTDASSTSGTTDASSTSGSSSTGSQATTGASTTTSSSGSIATLSIFVFVLSLVYLC